jgi:hypothetical protein
LDEHSKYYSFRTEEDTLILSDRLEINWREILIFPLPLFIVIIIVPGLWYTPGVWLSPGLWIGAFFIAVLIGFLYILLRYTASIYYSEIKINPQKGTLTSVKILFGKVRSVDVITSNFKVDHFDYIELNRSGKTKYLLCYKTHKDHNLLVIKSTEDKQQIENRILKSITT